MTLQHSYFSWLLSSEGYCPKSCVNRAVCVSFYLIQVISIKSGQTC